MREIFFIKKCIRSLLKSSLTVNDVSAGKCIFVNVHVQLYVAIQHLFSYDRMKHSYRILIVFKQIDSEANPASNTRRVSGELSISQSSVVSSPSRPQKMHLELPILTRTVILWGEEEYTNRD